MDLVTPGIGLVFWTTIIFLVLLIILGKVAWKPINNAIKKRSQSIEDALNQAEIAREEMKKLQADNERIMDEARAERDKMLKEAREIKEQIVAQAKSEAEKAAAKVMAEAEQKRDAMMVAAMADIKNQVLDLSIAVAEKVVRKQISTTPDQDMLVNDLVKEIKFN